MTFTERIVEEIAALQARLNAPLVLYVAVLLGVALLLRRGLLSATHVVWRLGWDRPRRLARLRSISDITLMAVILLLVLRKLVAAAPIITWLSVAVLTLACAIALPSWIRDFFAGVALANRKRFREGDQVRLRDAVGSVRHIGVLRTEIRARVAFARSRLLLFSLVALFGSTPRQIDCGSFCRDDLVEGEGGKHW